MMYARVPPSEPPTSSGNGTPGRPSSTIVFHVSSGKRWFSSMSCAWGASSFCAKSATISRTIVCSSVRSKAWRMAGSS